MSRKAEKKEAKQKASTRQLIGAMAITDYSLVTYKEGELVYFIVKPSNISVLSEASVGARIYALMTVLKGVAEIEMLCLNSRESFEDNKSFLRSRMEQEDNPIVRKLLEKDQTHLDRIQVQMATAREFLIIVRLRGEKESEVLPYLSRIEKSLKEQGFSVKRARISSGFWLFIMSRMSQRNVLRTSMASAGLSRMIKVSKCADLWYLVSERTG